MVFQMEQSPQDVFLSIQRDAGKRKRLLGVVFGPQVCLLFPHSSLSYLKAILNYLYYFFFRGRFYQGRWHRRYVPVLFHLISSYNYLVFI